MKRRKFLLGAGSAAAGGSALIGTGAFTSVSAERSVTVSVAGDEDAFLGLGPCKNDDGQEQPNGAFVTTNSGQMGLDLSSNNDDVPGNGVNKDAVSKFDNVFQITNQGTQEVGVWLDVAPAIDENGDPAIEFYQGGDQNQDIVGQHNAHCLPVGESICVGFLIRTFGISSGDDLFATRPGSDGEEMVINADANVACTTSGGGGSGGTYTRVWADSVGSNTSLGQKNNGNSLADSRDDPSAATGSPDGDFVSLGFGGELVLEFSDPLVSNPTEPDLVIDEVTNGRFTYPEEEATVEVKSSGSSWQTLGTASSKSPDGRSTFNFGGTVSEVEKVKIIDKTDSGAAKSNADGFDLDAVGGWRQ